MIEISFIEMRSAPPFPSNILGLKLQPKIVFPPVLQLVVNVLVVTFI
jgi:hypothetical protein